MDGQASRDRCESEALLEKALLGLIMLGEFLRKCEFFFFFLVQREPIKPGIGNIPEHPETSNNYS